jgi:hypothetical protein
MVHCVETLANVLVRVRSLFLSVLAARQPDDCVGAEPKRGDLAISARGWVLNGVADSVEEFKLAVLYGDLLTQHTPRLDLRAFVVRCSRYFLLSFVRGSLGGWLLVSPQGNGALVPWVAWGAVFFALYFIAKLAFAALRIAWLLVHAAFLAKAIPSVKAFL